MAQLSDDCFAFGGPLMSVEEASSLMAGRITPLTAIETVPLNEADGRALAQDILAKVSLPPFANSAVDGYAVSFDDLLAEGQTRLPLRGRVTAGAHLPDLGGNGGTARGINAKGQIVGYVDSDGILDTTFTNTAAIWEKDANGVYQLTTLGTFGGAQATLRDINNAGQIIGSSTNGLSGAAATSTPFVYQNGQLTAIGSLGGNTGSTNGINEFGEVVGASQVASGTNHGYVYIGGQITDLNDLVTAPLTYNGAAVTLTSAVSINNFGEIVATGTYSYINPTTGLSATGTRSYRLQTA